MEQIIIEVVGKHYRRYDIRVQNYGELACLIGVTSNILRLYVIYKMDNEYYLNQLSLPMYYSSRGTCNGSKFCGCAIDHYSISVDGMNVKFNRTKSSVNVQLVERIEKTCPLDYKFSDMDVDDKYDLRILRHFIMQTMSKNPLGYICDDCKFYVKYIMGRHKFNDVPGIKMTNMLTDVEIICTNDRVVNDNDGN